MTYAWEHLIDRAWPRFCGYVDARDPLGCWLWLGGRSSGQGNRSKYGTFNIGEGHTVRAHIFSCAAAGIEVEPGHHRDHLCTATLCVNPLHFEPTTPRENSLRRWNSTPTWRKSASIMDKSRIERCPFTRLMDMTRNEADILEQMDLRWLRPMDFGGFSGSHHAVTATRMVAKGWVEMEQRSSVVFGKRGSKVYRLTEKGAKALANHKAMSLPVGVLAQAVA